MDASPTCGLCRRRLAVRARTGARQDFATVGQGKSSLGSFQRLHGTGVNRQEHLCGQLISTFFANEPFFRHIHAPHSLKIQNVILPKSTKFDHKSPTPLGCLPIVSYCFLFFNPLRYRGNITSAGPNWALKNGWTRAIPDLVRRTFRVLAFLAPS